MLVADAGQYKENSDAVNIMTLHSAKGLEFKVVFILGMEEGVFPHQRSFESLSELEEERRLCYVGITRAKKKLFLTNARIRVLYGTDQVNRVSRFITEIDSSLLECLETKKVFEISKKIDYNNIKEVPKVDLSDIYKESDITYKVGDFVYHENFGAGTVLEVIVNKKDPKRTLLKIAFKLPYGIKTLMYNHKNLRKV